MEQKLACFIRDDDFFQPVYPPYNSHREGFSNRPLKKE